MPTYVVRLWMPDRPGALGAVASRIGAVRGDLVGIDILERGAGLAIDELVIALPDHDLVALLVKEIREVDGVEVEDVQEVPGDGLPDPRLAALETAALLMQETTPAGVLTALVVQAAHDFGAQWSAVVDGEQQVLHATMGTPPPVRWISAFIGGSRTAEAAPGGLPREVDELAWTPLATARLELVVARPGRPVRARERRQLAALASIADGRWEQLQRSRSLLVHPSA